MKANIHPEYGPVTIQCACGNTLQTKSTLKGTIQVDICSACHPFFSGKQHIMDSAGRIDRFKKKFGSKVALGGHKRSKPAGAKPGLAPAAPPKASTNRLSIKERLQAAKEKAASKVQ